MKYISSIKNGMGKRHSVLKVYEGDICWLSFNGSEEIKGYTFPMVRKLYESGCSGIICESYIEPIRHYDIYFIYSLTKADLALLSCMEYCGTSHEIPNEIYFPVLGSLLPVYWTIPVYCCSDDNECLFKEVTVKGSDSIETGLGCVSSFIFQYYKAAYQFSDMLNYNIDVLSSPKFELFCWDNKTLKPSVGTFYYNGFNEFRGTMDVFSETGFIDCNINENNAYRLHSDAVFQYIGCPLYIDRDNNLYLGYTVSDGLVRNLSGVVKYKITNLKKFNSIISKMLLLTNSDCFDVCHIIEPVIPSPVRLEV